MVKPVLAVDFDDVVYPLNKTFFRFHNEKFGTSMQYEDHKSYHYVENFSFLTDDLVLERITLFHQETDHLAVAPLLTRRHIERMQVIYDLHIVTARCDNHLTFMQEYIDFYFGEDAFKNMHFCNSYIAPGDIPGVKRNKSEVCASLRAEYLVDDALHNAVDVTQNARIPVLLLDHPWNQSEHDHPDVHRMENWDSILLALETVKNVERAF